MRPFLFRVRAILVARKNRSMGQLDWHGFQDLYLQTLCETVAL